eukprot:3406666-Rhodomonas_salina.4
MCDAQSYAVQWSAMSRTEVCTVPVSEVCSVQYCGVQCPVLRRAIHYQVATLQAMELAYRDWANLLAENAEAAYGADRASAPLEIAFVLQRVALTQFVVRVQAAKTVAWNAYIQPGVRSISAIGV